MHRREQELFTYLEMGTRKDFEVVRMFWQEDSFPSHSNHQKGERTKGGTQDGVCGMWIIKIRDDDDVNNPSNKTWTFQNF